MSEKPEDWRNGQILETFESSAPPPRRIIVQALRGLQWEAALEVRGRPSAADDAYPSFFTDQELPAAREFAQAYADAFRVQTRLKVVTGHLIAFRDWTDPA